MYIQKIVSELANIGERDSLLLYLTASSAKWSLSANAQQYPLVKKYILELRETEPIIIQDQIDSLLSISPGEIEEEMLYQAKEFKKRMGN